VLLPALANAEIIPKKSPYDSRMRVIAGDYSTGM
jgi:hypothetical protein